MAGRTALKFIVRRRPAVLVAPATSTPRELKRLSDIDDNDRLRYPVSIMQFYCRRVSMIGVDPMVVIRDSVAKALVDYYPWAGRLKELAGRKLAVDCTGEGVLFVEADADVRLEQFGDVLLPPFPCCEELISSVPSSYTILDSPLLLFQVTRLACGGFILAVRMIHTMADGQGLTQFLGAVAELARGMSALTVRPVWQRELLEARDPPQPCFPHYELEEVPNAKGVIMPLDEMVCHTFFFGPQEVATLRSQLAPNLQKHATRFDIVVGCLWKCRTAALSPDPGQEMRMLFSVDARGRKYTDVVGIPIGYYGNAFATPVAMSTANDLCSNPLSYAVELVKKAKHEVTMDYMRSMADIMVLNKRTCGFPSTCMYFISDTTRAKFLDLDFGWGKPVYGGPAEAWATPKMPWITSFLLPLKNARAEDGIAVPMYLPAAAMEKAVKEVDKMLGAPVNEAVPQQTKRSNL